MRTIHAIFRDGNLEPLEPINLPNNTRLTLALLDDDDDVPAEAIGQIAPTSASFAFLGDPLEDIYDESDGQPV